MNGQNKKGNDKKLILLFVGLIVIGIVCMKLKKTEQLDNKPEQEPSLEKKLAKHFESAFF